MKAKLLVTLFTAITFSVFSQTEFITKTNIVQFGTNYRDVNGQLYNIQFSKLWKIQKGEIAGVVKGGAVVKTFKIEDVYQDYYSSPPQNVSDGAYAPAGSYGWKKHKVGENKISGPTIFIQNYNIGVIGEQIEVPAMMIGTTNYNGSILEEWDCGKPHTEIKIIKVSKSK